LIHKLFASNFKCFKHLELDLAPLTVMIGPNASGKSSVLDAVECLFFQALGSYPHTFEAFKFEPLLDKHTAQYDYQSKFSSEKLTLSCEWSDVDNDHHQLKYETGEDERVIHLMNGSEISRGSIAGFNLPRPIPLKLSAQRIAEGTNSQSVKPVLKMDGYGLTEVLVALKLADDQKYTEIETKLKTFIPHLKKIRIARSENQDKIVKNELIFDFIGVKNIRAQNVSQGTLHLLAILTIVTCLDKPVTLLLDEIDHSLHPQAMKQLIDFLRQATQTIPRFQVIATTHSPILLDFFRYEEIRITHTLPAGESMCVPLSKHPKFELWKDEMFPGEFWNAVGDNWVRDQLAHQNPEPENALPE